MNEDLSEKLQATTDAVYKLGFLDGITAYAWWKDGVQQVGTTGTTLRDAVLKIEQTWNYKPPRETL